MRRLAAAILLTTLVLTGCGDDGDDDDTTVDVPQVTEAENPREQSETFAGSDSTQEAPPDGNCPYLPTDALNEAFNSNFAVVAATAAGCGFQSEFLTLSLARTDLETDPGQAAAEAIDSCLADTVIEVDAGDSAFACQETDPVGSYFEGSVLVTLTAVSASDPASVIDVLAEVLPSVTIPA